MAIEKNPYADLIEIEECKIVLLQEKISQCKQRIDLLKSGLDADEFDTLLTKSVASHDKDSNLASNAERGSSPTNAKRAKAPSSEGCSDPKRRLSDDVVEILRYVGRAGKTLDNLENFCATMNPQRNRTALRTMMSSYRKKHGFIESEHAGFFRLTDRAIEFLDAKYPESQKETPSAATEDVSVSQPNLA